MKIVFRTDASAQIGTGHLSRCLTLADALSGRGCQTKFICRDLDPLYASQIGMRGHALLNLSTSAERAEPMTEPLTYSHWLPTDQIKDAEAILLAADEDWDLTIVDHYALDARWEQRVRSRSAKIFVIDDLADRVHDCDFLLDQNLQPCARNRYLSLVSSKCDFLIGPQFALLRPEFAYWATERSSRDDRLNIFFGGVDPDAATLLALRALKLLPHNNADVVVGGTNPHLESISAVCASMQGIHLHVQTRNIAELFSHARLALGAGGATSWERCCVGLPALIASLAENQTKNCALLDDAGVAVNMGRLQDLSPETLVVAIEGLLADPGRLQDMAERGRALVDGNGTARVVDMVLNSAGVTP
jgi:UDP-2,4-diacetamido-2,4,6-trideoxy-beta-L-altropyranose hydrolase